MHGDPEVWERLGGVDLAFTPASFGQANLQVMYTKPLNIGNVWKRRAAGS